MRYKKDKHPEHVNMERWLVSYADFITLLFILFLILFAMSEVDKQKFQALMESFQSEVPGAGATIFDFPGSAPMQTNSGDSTGTKNQAGVEPKREQEMDQEYRQTAQEQAEREQFEKLKEKIEHYAEEKGISNDVKLKVTDSGLNLIITGTVLYEIGEADLEPQAKEVVRGVFDILSGMDNPIRIEGHTDNQPIHNSRFASNWELSSTRAVTLLRYLIEEYKIDPRRLAAAAYGEYHPVASNDTPQGRSMNRRVEIVILSQMAQESSNKVQENKQ